MFGAFAQTYLVALRGYIERGRQLKEVPLDDLHRLFVERHQEWARAPADLSLRRQSGDMCSEYALRRIEPPFRLIEAEIERIARAAEFLASDPNVREQITQDLRSTTREVRH